VLAPFARINVCCLLDQTFVHLIFLPCFNVRVVMPLEWIQIGDPLWAVSLLPPLLAALALLLVLAIPVSNYFVYHSPRSHRHNVVTSTRLVSKKIPFRFCRCPSKEQRRFHCMYYYERPCNSREHRPYQSHYLIYMKSFRSSIPISAIGLQRVSQRNHDDP